MHALTSICCLTQTFYLGMGVGGGVPSLIAETSASKNKPLFKIKIFQNMLNKYHNSIDKFALGSLFFK